MHYVALTFFIVVLVLFTKVNVKIAYLLKKLGFNLEVMKILLFELGLLIVAFIVLYSFDYSTTGFVLSGIVIGIIVPSLIVSTKKKVNPKQVKIKPNHMSQQEWNWREYEIGKSEWVDGGYGSW
jgi:hypothetical protein